MKYTTRGTPRKRAPGAGPKPKPPAERVLSKQIRVHVRTFMTLATVSLKTGQHVTEIVGELVDKAFPDDATKFYHSNRDKLTIPPECKPGQCPEGCGQ